jgi:hypothetical protein
VDAARCDPGIARAGAGSDGGTVLQPPAWQSASEFLSECRARAASLELDRTKGQKTRLAVICEAAGIH